MILDVTGTVLIPEKNGAKCPGNGENPQIECCCADCDYLYCCTGAAEAPFCETCRDPYCPWAQRLPL